MKCLKMYCCLNILLLCTGIALAGSPTSMDASMVFPEKAVSSKSAASNVPLEEIARDAKPHQGGMILQGGDTCNDAIDLGTALPIFVTGSTVGYTDDYDEACTQASTSPDVVYSFTPTSDMYVDLTLCAGQTDYDTKMYIYEGVCPGEAYYVCSDDSCTSAAGQDYVSALSAVFLTSGTTYYIVIDGYGSNEGYYELNIDEVFPIHSCPQDNTLFGQAPVGPNDDWSHGITELDWNGTELKLFESFSGLTNSIEGMHWWGVMAFNSGFSWLPCTESNPEVLIEFWADAGGQPDITNGPLYTYNIVPSMMSSDFNYNSFEGLYFEVDFDPVVPMASGWVSIQGQGDTDCWHLWTNSFDGDSSHYVYDSRIPGLESQEDDRSFCLTGTVEEFFGACCDDSTGQCEDNVSSFTCTGRFMADTLCADLDPACGRPGACCNDGTGTCDDGVFEVNCDGTRFLLEGLCADLDPTCGNTWGACCYDDGTCAVVSPDECEGGACPFDLDGNGAVGPGDVGVVKNNFGCDINLPECAALDFDSNGAVGPGDVGQVKNNFGPCAGPAGWYQGDWTECGEGVCPCAVPCPEGGIPEAEECGEDANSGCNNEPPTFETINCGDTICGTLWINPDAGQRDVDWFTVTVTETTVFTMTGSSELDTNFGLIVPSGVPGSPECPISDVTPFDNPAPCGDAFVMTECLVPGEHWFLVGAGNFDDNVPCAVAPEYGNRYTFTLDCEPCVLPQGACCDGDLVCTDGVYEGQCDGQWFEAQLCADVEPCPVQYCTPCYTESGAPDDYISLIDFAGINNVTGTEPEGCQYITYLDQVGTVAQGGTYTLTVEITVNGSYDQYPAIWIDYNQDGTLDETERTDLVNIDPDGAGAYTTTGDVTIPVDALLGETRMRVSERFNSAPSGPCEEQTYGSAEDYTINIVAP